MLRGLIRGLVLRVFIFRYKSSINNTDDIDWTRIVGDLQTLFNEEWYHKKYGKNHLLLKKSIAFSHYLIFGIGKNLNPNRHFNTEFYNKVISKNRRKTFSSYPALDFVLRPVEKFIDPSPKFNGEKYYAHNRDIQALQMNPFIHYIHHGIKEKRGVTKSIQLTEMQKFSSEIINASEDLKCVLLLELNSNDDLSHLDAKDFSIFEKIFALAPEQNPVDQLASKLNVSITYLNSSLEFDDIINLLENELKQFDIVCKFKVDSNIEANNVDINNKVNEVNYKTIFTDSSKLLATLKDQFDVGLVGAWSFFHEVLPYFDQNMVLYDAFIAKAEKESNWSVFVSGSYWFRPNILTLLKTNQLSRYRSKYQLNLKKESISFSLNTLDLLIGKYIGQLGYRISVRYPIDITYASFENKTIANNAVSNFTFQPSYNNIIAEQTINEDFDFLQSKASIDSEYYCEENPTSFNMDPVLHFLRFGSFLGINPASDFDVQVYTNFYLQDTTYINPYVHYWKEGKQKKYTNFPTEELTEIAADTIRSSNYFEPEIYSDNVEINADRTKDLIQNYCLVGWKNHLTTSTNFDEFEYRHLFLESHGVEYNPLLHYLLTQGNESPPRFPKLSTGIGDKLPIGAKRICLYAGFDIDGKIEKYVVDYLTELSKYADVYYLSASTIEREELKKIETITKGSWAIEHAGYDFGSYKRLAMNLVGWEKIMEYDELLLVNDSCYLLNDLAAVFDKMSQKNCDWWGMEATKGMYKTRFRAAGVDQAIVPMEQVKKERVSEYMKQTNYDFFVGSYFLAFRKPVFSSSEFQGFVQNIRDQTNKERLVTMYEAGLSRFLIKLGFNFETFIEDLYPFHPLFSMNHFDLIFKGYPFLKRYLLARNHYNVFGLSEWKQLITPFSTEERVNYIEQHILRVTNHQRYVRNLNVYESLMSKKAFAEAERSNGKNSNWWVFPVCAYDHGLNGNLRAMFEQVKDNPEIKKIILTRNKFIDYGGENVEIAPLKSRKGQDLLIRSKVAFLKHSPFRNLIYNVSGENRQLINLWHGIPLKRIGTQSLDQQHNFKNLIRDNTKLSGLIASSDIDHGHMRDSFEPLENEQVWTTGLPRNDFILMDENKLPKDMLTQLNLIDDLKGDKKLILFVPTFRNAQDYFLFTPEERMQIKDVLDRNNAVLGVRHHFASKHKAYYAQFKGLGAIDFTGGPFKDIEMLYRKSDVLMTDYSSSYIDYLLLGKPVISFAYDRDAYQNSERGFFYELDDVFPGAICEDFLMLLKGLENALTGNGKPTNYDEVVRFFHKYQDGQNSKRVLDKVLEGVGLTDIKEGAEVVDVEED